ncbi:hypothetical protein U1Q18_036666, partial [Sarracenia purpurea var. burkii]
SIALGFQCAMAMGQYRELLTAEQLKVHRLGSELERAKLEAHALVVTSRKNAESCCKLAME